MTDKKTDRLYHILFALAIIYILFIAQDKLKVGKAVDMYVGVPVYYNGFFNENVDGKHFSKDGYYYGLKWQCVEFVQRFYYDVLKHPMPDPTKNARDYFDPKVAEGKRNTITGLKQYVNGGKMAPKEKDILVFLGGKYGHVALVTKVQPDYVEIMQQNVYGKTKAKLKIQRQGQGYKIMSENQLAGWLRK